MTGEQIVLKVAPDGSVSAETKGIKGPRCLDTIVLLEELLEAQTIASDFTSEYRETSSQSITEHEVHDDLRQF